MDEREARRVTTGPVDGVSSPSARNIPLLKKASRHGDVWGK
jgi:hypothetical protein